MYREDTKRLLPCPSLWNRSFDRFPHFPTHWPNLSIPYILTHSLQPTSNGYIRSPSISNSRSYLWLGISSHPPVFGKFGTPHPLPKSPMRAHAHYTEVLHFHFHPSHTRVLHVGHHGCLSPIVRVLSLSPEAIPLSLGGHLCPPVGHTCPPRLLISAAFILPTEPFLLPQKTSIPFPLPYLSPPWCVKGEGGNAKPRCNARARVDAIYGAPLSADRRDCLGDETTPFRPHCKSPIHCGDWETKRLRFVLIAKAFPFRPPSQKRGLFPKPVPCPMRTKRGRFVSQSPQSVVPNHVLQHKTRKSLPNRLAHSSTFPIFAFRTARCAAP